jgi:hypothetical protein
MRAENCLVAIASFCVSSRKDADVYFLSAKSLRPTVLERTRMITLREGHANVSIPSRTNACFVGDPVNDMFSIVSIGREDAIKR